MRLGLAEIASLMYHEVTDHPTTSGFQRSLARRYAVGRDQFGGHLDLIAAGTCRPMLVGKVDPALRGRHLLLTFDDGGKSALYAADALTRRGWQGHFFIVTQRLGERTFLSIPEIRELRAAGHLVGSHSHSHPDIFSDLSPEGMAEEWRVSAEILEDALGERCFAASVPGGDISRAVLDSAAVYGFRYLFTSEPRLRATRRRGCWILGRMCLKGSVTPDQVRRLAAFRGWYRARLERRLKVLARWGSGPLYRAYVRRRTRPWRRRSTPTGVAALTSEPTVEGP